MARLHPDTEITIARETAVKPPPDPPPHISTQLERIRAALADEILAGKVERRPDGDLDLHPHRQSSCCSPPGRRRSMIRSRRSPPRSPGRSTRSRAASASTATTDTDPIKTVTFPSNFELSEARAKSVAGVLKTGLSQPDRRDGVGQRARTIRSRRTTRSENKAKNRRVEDFHSARRLDKLPDGEEAIARCGELRA